MALAGLGQPKSVQSDTFEYDFESPEARFILRVKCYDFRDYVCSGIDLAFREPP